MFASRIKYLRLSKALNQVQLAERLGVKKQSISNWENDNIMPSVEMLIRIADFFNVSTDYLLGRETPKLENLQMLDITGLSPQQAEHIQFLIDDLRNTAN